MRNMLTPPVYSQHRQLFEASYHGDENLARYISLGSHIELASTELATAARTPQECTDLYHAKYGWLVNYSETQVAEIAAHPAGNNVLLYRTKLLNTLLEQVVSVPVLHGFHPHHSYAARKKLVETEGIYGAVGSVLEDTLAGLDSAPRTEKGHLISFINKGTAIALANRAQDPNSITLPALPYDAMQHGIDAVTYSAVRGRRLPLRSLQVRSDESRHPILAHNERLLIGGIALGNSAMSLHWQTPHFLHTARTIISELNATGDKDDERVVDAIANELHTAIHNGQHFVHIPKARTGSVVPDHSSTAVT